MAMNAKLNHNLHHPTSHWSLLVSPKTSRGNSIPKGSRLGIGDEAFLVRFGAMYGEAVGRRGKRKYSELTFKINYPNLNEVSKR